MRFLKGAGITLLAVFSIGLAVYDFYLIVTAVF